MIVDSSSASAFANLIYLVLYGYIDSFLKAVGIRRANIAANESAFDGIHYHNKSKHIEECISNVNSVDLWELRELALSEGGLLQAQYRQKAWPKLVGLTEEDNLPELVSSPISIGSISSNESSWCLGTCSTIIEDEKKSEMEGDFDLIRRDGGRSVIFRYNNESPGMPPVTPPYASERLARVLENTITQGNVSLHYYQGLHDIAGVILHNMDYHVEATTQILKRISQSHLRDAMRENFSNLNWFLSVILPPLLEKVDPFVHYAIQVAQVELATICLPWMITWFTHNIHDAKTAGRLVDAFLSGHPLMPVYFAIALITHPILKKELVHADNEEDASTILMSIKMMPFKLKTIDKESICNDQRSYISVQEVLEDCISIMNRIPPRSLLNLVDSGAYPRSELLRGISSISLFKAPASWSMASGGLPRSWKELDEIEGATYCVRAKLASGVPMLMNTVSESSVIDRKAWGSRKHLQKKKKTMKIRKLIRIILGNTNKGKRS